MNTYRNPWFKRNGSQGPEFYETDSKPFEHAGCLIYERIHGKCWDVVKDGVCQTQRAGKRGAMEGAELVNSPAWAA
jgi:hypothetical protein